MHGKIPQSVGKYRSVWENVGKRGKMSKSKGKYQRRNGENSFKKNSEGGNISEERKIINGKIIINNDYVRKLA